MTNQLALWEENLSPFDRIRHGDEKTGYWLARELMPLLDYSQWQKFVPVIKRAMQSLEKSGFTVSDHFTLTDELITGGKGNQQKVKGYQLSRRACYAIALNGDPNKPVIADAQAYFMDQTRRQELMSQAEDRKRLNKRSQAVTEYQMHGRSKDWAETRVESKASQKELNATLYDTHEDHKPDFAAIAAMQNTELLGMTKREIVAYLGLLPREEPNYRDRLGEYALDALKQVNRASIAHMKQLDRVLTDDEQLEIIRTVIQIVAPTMRDLAAYAGQDFLSGAQLDAQGKPLIARNVRLLK